MEENKEKGIVHNSRIVSPKGVIKIKKQTKTKIG